MRVWLLRLSWRGLRQKILEGNEKTSAFDRMVDVKKLLKNIPSLLDSD